MTECPICSSPVPPPRENVNWSAFDCPRCGRWQIDSDASGITRLLAHKIGEWDAQAVHRRSRLSHILRRQQQQVDKSRWANMPSGNLESWHLDEPLPSPSEQLDQLIIWIAKNQLSPSTSVAVKGPEVSAWIGTSITRGSSEAGLSWLLQQEEINKFIENLGVHSGLPLLRLRMPGWLRYETLTQLHVESRKVLMAMKFGDDELDQVVENCFIPAVRRAGFELRTIIQEQPAGLIDDQLRVALRTSRFVVADLTHGSNGVLLGGRFCRRSGTTGYLYVSRSGMGAIVGLSSLRSRLAPTL